MKFDTELLSLIQDDLTPELVLEIVLLGLVRTLHELGLSAGLALCRVPHHWNWVSTNCPTIFQSVSSDDSFGSLLLCIVSYYRLEPPNPSAALNVLGSDSRNFDGSPAKKNAWNQTPVAHRAAGSDAPENTLAALRLVDD